MGAALIELSARKESASRAEGIARKLCPLLVEGLDHPFKACREEIARCVMPVRRRGGYSRLKEQRGVHRFAHYRPRGFFSYVRLEEDRPKRSLRSQHRGAVSPKYLVRCSVCNLREHAVLCPSALQAPEKILFCRHRQNDDTSVGYRENHL